MLWGSAIIPEGLSPTLAPKVLAHEGRGSLNDLVTDRFPFLAGNSKQATGATLGGEWGDSIKKELELAMVVQICNPSIVR